MKTMVEATAPYLALIGSPFFPSLSLSRPGGLTSPWSSRPPARIRLCRFLHQSIVGSLNIKEMAWDSCIICTRTTMVASDPDNWCDEAGSGGDPIRPLRICMIGAAGGFIGSHLFEKLMAENPHKVLAVDVYSDKIKNLLQPPPEHGQIQFHRLNIKNDSRLEGLIRMSDLIRLSAGKIKHLFESPLGARPDPVPPTQHQERLLTRGPHQDFGSG